MHHHQTFLTTLWSFSFIFGTGIFSLPSSEAVDGDCASKSNTDTQQECSLDQDGNFYAWSTPASEDSLINALFPNITQLELAWEVHPLLSRVSFTQQKQQKQPEAQYLDHQIPTLLHDRTLITKWRKLDSQPNNVNDPLFSLFAVDDTPTILSQPMTHGSDYKLVKKIILQEPHPQAGEEYNGMMPKSHYSTQEALQHFHYGGFSLVINKMQKRWGSVATMAIKLEEELGVVSVGVNLYLTPEVVLEKASDSKLGEVRQGFEAHWDWMDVIVVQLSGRKRWSVAREPSVYLSNKDQKHKPTNKELEQVHRYGGFTLCPGDVLYIPRGHIHNASTMIFDNMENEDGEQNGVDLNKCPSYPKDLAAAAHLANRLNGPSLHLTFGLLQSNDATVETLLHHALDAYFASPGSSSTYDKVAISAKTCTNFAQADIDYDIEWKSVMHLSLAEVARRQHACDTIISKPGSTMKKPKRCNGGTAILRQSVPLLLLTNNNLKDDITDGEKSTQQQYSNLKQTFLLALDMFGISASIPETIGFIQSHLFVPPSDEGLTFHYPGYSKKDVVLCPDALKTLSGEMYTQLLKLFDQFAKDNFHEVLKDMNRWGKEQREEVRQLQLLDLEMVGQRGGGVAA